MLFSFSEFCNKLKLFYFTTNFGNKSAPSRLGILPDVFWWAHNPDFDFLLVISFFTTRVISFFYHPTFVIFCFCCKLHIKFCRNAIYPMTYLNYIFVTKNWFRPNSYVSNKFWHSAKYILVHKILCRNIANLSYSPGDYTPTCI